MGQCAPAISRRIAVVQLPVNVRWLTSGLVLFAGMGYNFWITMRRWGIRQGERIKINQRFSALEKRKDTQKKCLELWILSWLKVAAHDHL
jgi:hypothetical protein